MNTAERPRLDIVIPAHEYAKTPNTPQSPAREIEAPPRLPICYERADGDAPAAIRDNRDAPGDSAIGFAPRIDGAGRTVARPALALN